jgi:hypothetical protein
MTYARTKKSFPRTPEDGATCSLQIVPALIS